MSVILPQTTFPRKDEPRELLRGGVAHEGSHDATSGGTAMEDQEQDGAAHQARHDAGGHRATQLADHPRQWKSRHSVEGLEQERELQLKWLFQVSFVKVLNV